MKRDFRCHRKGCRKIGVWYETESGRMFCARHKPRYPLGGLVKFPLRGAAK